MCFLILSCWLLVFKPLCACLSFSFTFLLHTPFPLPLSVCVYICVRVCVNFSLCLWIRWRLCLGEFTDSKGSMKGGDSEPIIFSLMVPRVQGWATTKRLQETSILDKPAPPSLHCHSVGINSQLSGGEWSTHCSTYSDTHAVMDTHTYTHTHQQQLESVDLERHYTTVTEDASYNYQHWTRKAAWWQTDAGKKICFKRKKGKWI